MKARVMKMPANGEWKFADVGTEADGHLPLVTMRSMASGLIGSRHPAGAGL